MEFVSFHAGVDDDGRRLDRILHNLNALSSDCSIYEALRKGLIKLNGRRAEGNSRVVSGDTITIASFLVKAASSSDSPSYLPSATYPPFSTLFRNEHIWIINKPYGIPVQPSALSKTSLSELVLAEYKSNAQNTSLSFQPGPLHRLDRNTTGIVAFSQSLLGAQWFSKAISERHGESSLGKTYIGIVEGLMASSESWTDFIDAERQTEGAPGIMNGFSADKSAFHTVKVGKTGVCASTNAFPLAAGSYKDTPVTLVQFDILTGRKHQIRAQSSFHHHPLLGDTAYGGSRFQGDRDFMLHAIRLTVPAGNPIGLPSVVYAEPDETFKNILASFLIKWDGRLILK